MHNPARALRVFAHDVAVASRPLSELTQWLEALGRGAFARLRSAQPLQLPRSVATLPILVDLQRKGLNTSSATSLQNDITTSREVTPWPRCEVC